MDAFAEALEGNRKIELAEGFIDDMQELLTNTLRGHLISFTKQFRHQIGFINDHPVQKLVKVDSNEVLKHVSTTMYSLHLKGTGYNVRFLCAPEGEKIVFLVAFNEKSGKSNTGYKKYISIAEERLIKWRDREDG